MAKTIFCAGFTRLGGRIRHPEARYDLVIVGGGPAGLSAADFARRQGLSVALVERYRVGGNSLNSGSIPSKAIIRAARVALISARR